MFKHQPGFSVYENKLSSPGTSCLRILATGLSNSFRISSGTRSCTTIFRHCSSSYACVNRELRKTLRSVWMKDQSWCFCVFALSGSCRAIAHHTRRSHSKPSLACSENLYPFPPWSCPASGFFFYASTRTREWCTFNGADADRNSASTARDS